MSGTHLNVACDGPTARRATGRKPGVNCQTLIKSDNPQRKLGVFAFMEYGKFLLEHGNVPPVRNMRPNRRGEYQDDTSIAEGFFYWES